MGDLIQRMRDCVAEDFPSCSGPVLGHIISTHEIMGEAALEIITLRERLKIRDEQILMLKEDLQETIRSLCGMSFEKACR